MPLKKMMPFVTIYDLCIPKKYKICSQKTCLKVCQYILAKKNVFSKQCRLINFKFIKKLHQKCLFRCGAFI